MSRLYGAGVDLLERAMRFRLERQSLLATNVANADTPGYRRVDLREPKDFGRMLDGMVATRAGHLSAGEAERRELERGPRGTRPDGNGVDLDAELLQLSRNAGTFTKQAEVLARLMALRKVAITGEAR